MMKLFRRRRKGNNKGLSLVELVCAVAIFGVIVAAVGSVMIVSAQNYSQGTYEIDVQQEAQTTTNLIGNLIVSADTAYFNSALAMPLLRIDESDDVAYEIEYDSLNGTLNYSEIDKNTGAEASGVLAENVVGFSTNLPATATDFSTDRNVEVSVSIEKGGRTYDASYSMTARNGSSDSTVTDSAKIIVESEIVLEPGQTYELPVTVLGTIANKAFVSSKGNATDPITLSHGANSVTITVGTNATGTIPIVISTVEKKEDGITPVATKDVSVKIRRIESVSGVKSFTGSEGTLGSSYVMDFGFTGTNLEKVYGKDFDTNYVNPKQFAFSYSMTGADAGKTVMDYIDASTIVETTIDDPEVSLSLKDSLPEGAKIAITCTALHTSGTNKSGLAYTSPALSKTLYIEMPRFSINGAINRGNDDNGVEITISGSFLSDLNNTYDNVVRIIEYYEATIDSNGNFIKGTKAFERRSDRAGDDVEAGNRLAIRPADSNRLVPDQAYVIVTRVECYNAGSSTPVWPTSSTPTSEYMCEFPLSPLSLSYDCHALNEGVQSNYLQVTKGTNVDLDILCVGLDLSRYQNNIKWDVQRKTSASDSYSGSYTNLSCSCSSNGATDGSGKMNLFFQETGYYKFSAKLSNYNYYDYDGVTSKTANCTLNDGTDVGVVYIRVTE